MKALVTSFALFQQYGKIQSNDLCSRNNQTYERNCFEWTMLMTLIYLKELK